MKTRVVEEHVAELSKKYGRAPVFFDENQATGMIQELKAKNVSVEAVPFTARSNDKMTSLLHKMLRDGLIALPDRDELLDELRSVRVVETRQGLLSIDSAPGRHDDQTDALGICAVQLMERSAATAAFGSSADLPSRPMPRGGLEVGYYEEPWNPLRDSEWERRRGWYER